MNDRSQLLINAIRGPVTMITVGVLFAIDKFSSYHFGETWPVLLIVIGAMQLLGGRRRRPDFYPPPAASAPPYAPPAYAAPPAQAPAAPQATPATTTNDNSGEAHS